MNKKLFILFLALIVNHLFSMDKPNKTITVFNDTPYTATYTFQPSDDTTQLTYCNKTSLHRTMQGGDSARISIPVDTQGTLTLTICKTTGLNKRIPHSELLMSQITIDKIARYVQIQCRKRELRIKASRYDD